MEVLNTIYVVDEWEDDEGNIKIHKPVNVATEKQAFDVIMGRLTLFIGENKECYEKVTRKDLEEFMKADGFFCYCVGEGSSDYRKYFKIITITIGVSTNNSI